MRISFFGNFFGIAQLHLTIANVGRPHQMNPMRNVWGSFIVAIDDCLGHLKKRAPKPNVLE